MTFQVFSGLLGGDSTIVMIKQRSNSIVSCNLFETDLSGQYELTINLTTMFKLFHITRS